MSSIRLPRLKLWWIMSLTNIPFIRLATCAFYTSPTSPNSPSPKHERIASQVPAAYIQWASIIMRVSNWFGNYIVEKPSLSNLRIDHAIFFAIAEIGTFLASANPLSKQGLSSIVWNDGKPDNLRMSKATSLGSIFGVGNMDKVDGSPLPWTILPVRGQHSERGSRSSSKLHRLDVGIYWMVPSANGWRLVGYGIRFLGHDIWENPRCDIFNFRISYLVLGSMSKVDATLMKRFGKKWGGWAQRAPYYLS